MRLHRFAATARISYVDAPTAGSATPLTKRFIQEEEMMLDAYHLGAQIFASGFRPSFIVGLWRGGSAVGIAVQECLQYLGVETDHISIRTSYRGRESYEQLIDGEGEIGRAHV